MQVDVGDLTFDVRVGRARGRAAGAAAARLPGDVAVVGGGDAAARQGGAAHATRPTSSATPPARGPDEVDGLLDAEPRAGDRRPDDGARTCDRADVVGHDWGANVAWTLAGWHPDRVRTLTAVSVPHPAAYTVAYRDRSRAEGALGLHPAVLAGGQGRGGAARRRRAAAAADARRRGETGIPAEAVDEYVSVLSAPGALTAALNWYRAMSSGTAAGPGRRADDLRVERRRRRDRPDRRRGVRQFVTGDYRFVELPGVTHWIPEQAPEQLATAILAQVQAG